VFFPNPVSGVLSLLNFNTTIYDLVIYDELGNMILKQKSSTSIDLTKLNNGVYFCSIIYQDKILRTEKLILIN
jgi:hypothetical protein